ncbi:hypothetical protein M2451_002594 [Dysgonomonas sp. PFB1-18]|uniref:DUF7168 domain-containing protein n=1 Tax=unclassified Dysgonomonas TaxID=2630389 RepID=UPI002474E5D1|nr:MULTISPECIES: DUF2786 domain-containing protein [unclassified Dysgonomonas]MDH6308075.1 hypothetical protein [Dysgonomonas sp. PF1-14]MDH6339614.1 hypothetical protein [Dysgonomonas sp. PF1-16]MDH6381265.1 hypothetical protein [Dysgonomonas sp. PFB1-18]MDH6398477.1 hypothetical protein [Dysgonomonas sp. PF1-23]
MENKKEAIKRKIKALLVRTTENGATEAEALAAMAKAKELMMEYYISEHELTDPYAFEKCVFKEVDLIKSGYELGGFYNSLTRLFDCEYFYNYKRISFFGFEEDTELCAYFYTFIIRACMAEKDKYMNSKECKALKNIYHGRTLAASFVKGFIWGISQKMEDMYQSRKKDLPEEVGLMVIDKRNKVNTQFEEQNLKIKTHRSNLEIKQYSAFLDGEHKGLSTELNYALNGGQKEVLSLPE